MTGEGGKEDVLDGVAAGLSSLCLLHCLLLPLALALAPAVTGLAGDLLHGPAWVHWLLLAVAAPVSVQALRRGMDVHGDPDPWRLALLGFGLMAIGAMLHGWTPVEQLLTVLGGVFVALGHWRNWKARRA